MLSAPASAQKESFKDVVQRAYDHFDTGDYASARAEFEKAYQMQPDPLLLFNIASTYRREGNDKVALAYYTKFLDVAPKDHPQRRQAEEVVDFLRDKVQASKGGGSGSGAGGGAGGGGGGGDDIVRGPEADTPAKPGTALIWSGIGAGAVGVIGIGYAIFEGQRARDRHNELEALMPGSEWSEERIAQFEEGESAEKRAIVFSILGTAAVATGATLFVIGMQKRNKASTERAVSVVPYAGDDEAGVSLIGRF